LLHQTDSPIQGKTVLKNYGGGIPNPIQVLPPEQARSDNWRPQAQLSYERSNHPLDLACTRQHLGLIVQYCNRTPTVRFVQHATKGEMHVTTTGLRDLLSHHKPIVDDTVTLYLELLTTQYNITFLATNTIPKLRVEGWSTVQQSFAAFRNRRCTNTRPQMSGESAIIIPCFVDGCHWVTVVRREVNNQVYFLFADDLYNSRTEQDMKRLLSTEHTSETFYPLSAKWIACRNYTYIPHSNECGPRSLIAATIMALHPSPSNYILLPCMHQNLAQISRTWVAMSLLTNNINHSAVTALCSPSRATFPHVTRMASKPYHLIQWPMSETIPSNHSSKQPNCNSQAENKQNSSGSKKSNCTQLTQNTSILSLPRITKENQRPKSCGSTKLQVNPAKNHGGKTCGSTNHKTNPPEMTSTSKSAAQPTRRKVPSVNRTIPIIPILQAYIESKAALNTATCSGNQ